MNRLGTDRPYAAGVATGEEGDDTQSSQENEMSQNQSLNLRTLQLKSLLSAQQHLQTMTHQRRQRMMVTKYTDDG